MLEIISREHDTVMQIRQLLSSIPSQVKRQQPVRFEDAHGRHFPLHIEFVNSFSAFKAVLELRFEDVPGMRKVRNMEHAMRDIENSTHGGHGRAPFGLGEESLCVWSLNA